MEEWRIIIMQNVKYSKKNIRLAAENIEIFYRIEKKMNAIIH